MKTFPKIPTASEASRHGASGADLNKLCANFKHGCNGVTDGPQNGRLTLCDTCAEFFLIEEPHPSGLSGEHSVVLDAIHGACLHNH